jgi:hypothetical protein
MTLLLAASCIRELFLLAAQRRSSPPIGIFFGYNGTPPGSSRSRRAACMSDGAVRSRLPPLAGFAAFVDRESHCYEAGHAVTVVVAPSPNSVVTGLNAPPPRLSHTCLRVRPLGLDAPPAGLAGRGLTTLHRCPIIATAPRLRATQC